MFHQLFAFVGVSGKAVKTSQNLLLEAEWLRELRPEAGCGLLEHQERQDGLQRALKEVERLLRSFETPLLEL